MNRWRTELLHRLPDVFNGNGFPSARTGSDYTGQWWFPNDLSYYAFIGLPSLPTDMRNLSQWSVDRELRRGRTIASRLGGVALLRLKDAQGIFREIGSWFALPANSTVNGEIVLRAAVSGAYRLRVVEDNFSRTVHDSFRNLNAGNIITIPISFPYLGGNRFYHLIVEHSNIFTANDTIYSSPIFIQEQ